MIKTSVSSSSVLSERNAAHSALPAATRGPLATHFT